jgi:hypothetical protein
MDEAGAPLGDMNYGEETAALDEQLRVLVVSAKIIKSATRREQSLMKQ